MNYILHGMDLSEEAVLRTIAEVLPETTLAERALIKGLGEGLRMGKLSATNLEDANYMLSNDNNK